MNPRPLVSRVVAALGCALVGCCALIGCALVGCSEEAAPDPAASTSSRPGRVVPLVDQAAYCSKICARATSCGLEAAESLARGTPGEVALMGKLKAGAGSTEQTCVAECRKEPLGDADQRGLTSAERCVEQTTCDTFSRCLDDAASAHSR